MLNVHHYRIRIFLLLLTRARGVHPATRSTSCEVLNYWRRRCRRRRTGDLNRR